MMNTSTKAVVEQSRGVVKVLTNKKTSIGHHFCYTIVLQRQKQQLFQEFLKVDIALFSLNQLRF